MPCRLHRGNTEPRKRCLEGWYCGSIGRGRSRVSAVCVCARGLAGYRSCACRAVCGGACVRSSPAAHPPGHIAPSGSRLVLKYLGAPIARDSSGRTVPPLAGRSLSKRSPPYGPPKGLTPSIPRVSSEPSSPNTGCEGHALVPGTARVGRHEAIEVRVVDQARGLQVAEVDQPRVRDRVCPVYHVTPDDGRGPRAKVARK